MYKCDGWPYEQCEMLNKTLMATCINPYTIPASNTSSGQFFSNYPKCATIPSGCQRCDDVCSIRDGKKDRLDYSEQKANETMSFYKTDGSPNSVRAVTFLILYVPQLILSLVMVIDVTNKDSWKILLDQPSVILMAVFTHFTCARMNIGCGSMDVRVKVSKFHTILNMIVSVISYIIVFITAHLLLDDEDWGWDLEGMHASILSQLFLAVPFIVMGVATTLGKMNF